MEYIIYNNIVHLFLLTSLFDILTADVGLKFLQSPETLIAPLKDEVIFECALNVPAEQVRWRHNGKLLPFRENSTSKSNLIFNLLDNSQEGDYQCIAWYGSSALASTPARLSLAALYPPPVVTQEHRMTVTIGNNVVIRCDAPYSNPPPTILFYKNNQTLLDADILESGSLLLTNVSVRDSGVYRCSVTNVYVSDDAVFLPTIFYLTVTNKLEKRAPKFLFVPSTNVTVEAGTNTTLECVGVGEPVPSVTWYRETNTPLPVGRSFITTRGLQLINIIQSDEGKYVCEISNGIGPNLIHEISLTYLEPAILVKGSSDQMVEEGSRVRLECVVKGSPPPRVTWLLNAEPVNNDSRIITNGSRIQIMQVEKRHAGIYQCMAENELGAVFGSSMLRVSPRQVTANNPIDPIVRTSSSRPHPGKKKGSKNRKKAIMIPPSRPNITRLTETSVMVRWHVPSNIGLPIQFFKVQHKELSSQKGKAKSSGWMTNNEDIDPHLHSYEVINLEPGRHYRFRIAAVYSNNDNKLGPNSAKFYLPKGPSKYIPPAPVLKFTSSGGPNSIYIMWEFNQTGRTPIGGFYVYYRSTLSAGDYMKATVEGAHVRSYIINHLHPDTGYDIKLQSFIVDAASNFSAILTQKTERLSTVSPPPTEATDNNLENSSNETSKSSNQLYITLVAALSGLALLLMLCVGIFLCNKHRQPSSGSQDGDERDKRQQIPMESFSINGRPVSRSNGHVPKSNGFIPSKVNITSNPLADTDQDTNQNVMEISFITRTSTTTTTTTTNQNNNYNNHRNSSRARELKLGKFEVNHQVSQVCSSSEDSVCIHGNSPVLSNCGLESDAWRRCDVARTVENYV